MKFTEYDKFNLPEINKEVLAQWNADDLFRRSIELRESSGGKYLGVTITVTATSRAQLDDLYRALTAHPLVKVVL